MKLALTIVWLQLVSCWGRQELKKKGLFKYFDVFLKCDHSRTLNLDVSNINVHFYNFPNNDMKTFKIHQAGKGILSYKGLVKTRKFIIFVGGFKSNVTKIEQRIGDAFRTLPNSYLILLDHSPYTNDNAGKKESYDRSVQHAYYIGKALADMLTILRNGGISPKNMHCIGHSLGGQMLGHTGEIFLRNSKEKIWRITALDPAGPCFSDFPIQEQVRSGVAEYVEVYLCNAGALGSTTQSGDINFMVNKKGQAQPNCGTPWLPRLFDISGQKCHHGACIDIFAATVKNPSWYSARECDSYKKFKDGKCVHNKETLAGFWNPGTAKGTFYFSTKDTGDANNNHNPSTEPSFKKLFCLKWNCAVPSLLGGSRGAAAPGREVLGGAGYEVVGGAGYEVVGGAGRGGAKNVIAPFRTLCFVICMFITSSKLFY